MVGSESARSTKEFENNNSFNVSPLNNLTLKPYPKKNEFLCTETFALLIYTETGFKHSNVFRTKF
jgi:hypothetical protein